jgi:hypothetical protein
MSIKKNKKIGWALVPAVCVLLTGLAACDRLGNGLENGEKVAVSLSSGDLEPWGAETIVRGASATPIETASATLEGNWVLEADLIEDPAPATRAGGVISGAVLRVYAVDGSNQVADEKNYVWQPDGSLEPGAGGPIVVEPGEYRLLAYFYNALAATTPLSTGTTVPVSPYVDGISTNDLISGEAGSPVEVTASGVSGSAPELTLKHRFSRVKYAIYHTVAPNPSLTDLSVSLTNSYRATLKKSDGGLTKSTTAVQPLVDSDYRIVYTHGEAPKLNISGKIQGVSFTNISVSYATALAAGKSYTLRINVKKGLVWAGSNIYWDGSKMTFASYNDRSKEMYQGVFFRWGVLLGFDPSRYNGSDDWSKAGHVLYVPSYTSANVHSWSIGHEEWEDILPTLEGETFAEYGETADSFESYSDYPNKKGDICRYLTATKAVSGSWRMPTLSELVKGDNSGNFINSNTDPNADLGIYNEDAMGEWRKGKWMRIGGSSWPDLTTTNASPDGTYSFPAIGANYSGYAGFPPPGGRRAADGRMFHFGGIGIYWSSSASSATGFADHYDFGTNGIRRFNDNRGCAYPVRCLLDE